MLHRVQEYLSNLKLFCFNFWGETFNVKKMLSKQRFRMVNSPKTRKSLVYKWMDGNT